MLVHIRLGPNPDTFLLALHRTIVPDLQQIQEILQSYLAIVNYVDYCVEAALISHR